MFEIDTSKPFMLSALTSSLVVILTPVKYVWKPASPATDHIEKKAISATTGLKGPSDIASAKLVAFDPTIIRLNLSADNKSMSNQTLN